MPPRCWVKGRCPETRASCEPSAGVLSCSGVSAARKRKKMRANGEMGGSGGVRSLAPSKRLRMEAQRVLKEKVQDLADAKGIKIRFCNLKARPALGPRSTLAPSAQFPHLESLSPSPSPPLILLHLCAGAGATNAPPPSLLLTLPCMPFASSAKSSAKNFMPGSAPVPWSCFRSARSST